MRFTRERRKCARLLCEFIPAVLSVLVLVHGADYTHPATPVITAAPIVSPFDTETLPEAGEPEWIVLSAESAFTASGFSRPPQPIVSRHLALPVPIHRVIYSRPPV